MGGKNWELGIENSNTVSWKIAKVGNYKNSELKNAESYESQIIKIVKYSDDYIIEAS